MSEQVWLKLLDYGLTGVILACVFAALGWFTFKVLPGLLDRSGELTWLRAELDSKRREYLESVTLARKDYLESINLSRSEYLAALADNRSELIEALDKVESRAEKTAAAFSAAISELTRRLDRIEGGQR